MQKLVKAFAVMAALGLLVAIPATASAKTSKTDKSQNKTLKKQGKSIKSLGTSTKKLGKSAKSAASAIAALKIVADRGDKNAKTVLDAAPAIVNGLTALQNGLLAAKSGLTGLQTLATSQEYGIAQMTVISAGPTPNTQVGSFIVTPDIPDAAQQAQSTQQFVAANTGTLTVSYGVRSNETDGTGAANPAALCRTTVTNEGGATESTTGGPVPGLAAFVPINTKSSLTSTDPANAGFPFGPKTSGTDADNLTTLNTAIAVTTGDTYTVGMSCVDTSPSPTDPSA